MTEKEQKDSMMKYRGKIYAAGRATSYHTVMFIVCSNIILYLIVASSLGIIASAVIHRSRSASLSVFPLFSVFFSYLLQIYFSRPSSSSLVTPVFLDDRGEASHTHPGRGLGPRPRRLKPNDGRPLWRSHRIKVSSRQVLR